MGEIHQIHVLDYASGAYSILDQMRNTSMIYVDQRHVFSMPSGLVNRPRHIETM